MLNKHKFLLFLLLAISLPCSANHGVEALGVLVEIAIGLMVVAAIIIHAICITAYYRRSGSLRIIGGVLYLLVFLVLFWLTAFHLGFIILLLPALAFFYFIIVKERKKS